MYFIFSATAEHSVHIEATPWSIWRTVADLSAYGRWNALFPSVAGELKVGHTLNVGARITGDSLARLPCRVVAVEHMRETVWTASYTVPGFLDIVYGVVIVPVDRYTSRLTMGVQLHGLLVPLLGRKMKRHIDRHMGMTLEQLAAMAQHHARQGMTVE